MGSGTIYFFHKFLDPEKRVRDPGRAREKSPKKWVRNPTAIFFENQKSDTQKNGSGTLASHWNPKKWDQLGPKKMGSGPSPLSPPLETPKSGKDQHESSNSNEMGPDPKEMDNGTILIGMEPDTISIVSEPKSLGCLIRAGLFHF